MKIIIKYFLMSAFLLIYNTLLAQKISGPVVNSLNCGTVSGTKSFFPPFRCNNPWQLIPEASDEFNGNSVDLSKWDYRAGWGHAYTLGNASTCPFQDGTDGANGDLAYYTDGNNIEVSNGTFKIYIKQETITAHVFDYCYAGCTCPQGNYDNCILSDGLPNLRTWYFTSGSLFSKNKIDLAALNTPGKFEIRCKLPKIDGLWPAFWLYGNHEQEIDVLESGNKNFLEDKDISSKNFTSTTHRNPTNPFQSSPSGHDNHCHTGGTTDGTINTGIDLNNGFHTYSVEWDAYGVIFKFDNTVVYQYAAIMDEQTKFMGYGKSTCNVSAAYYFPLPDILPTLLEPMNIIVNCAVANFCSPQNPLWRGTYPATMEIDYIHVYKRVPSQEPIYTCTPLRPDDVVINDDHIHGSHTLHIKKTITNDPSVTIENDADVWWTAENFIELTPDFIVEEGATFTAEIAECQHGFLRTTNDSTNVPKSYTAETAQIEYAGKEQAIVNSAAVNSFLSPNPNNGKFNFQLKENTPSKVFIYNTLGQLIYQSSIINNQSSIDLSSHSKGIYFIKVISGEKIYTEKIILQ